MIGFVWLVKCECCFRAMEWSRDPIPGPLKNGDLVCFNQTVAWSVWKLSMLWAACPVMWLSHYLQLWYNESNLKPCYYGYWYIKGDFHNTGALQKGCLVLTCIQDQLLVCRYSCTMICPASKTLLECLYHRKIKWWFSMWKQTCDYEPLPQTNTESVLRTDLSIQT